jgi:hypothetical protein
MTFKDRYLSVLLIVVLFVVGSVVSRVAVAAEAHALPVSTSHASPAPSPETVVATPQPTSSSIES